MFITQAGTGSDLGVWGIIQACLFGGFGLFFIVIGLCLPGMTAEEEIKAKDKEIEKLKRDSVASESLI